MNQPVDIESFIELGRHSPIIDVRSPGEFQYGHIPGAHNIPLFSDEERAVVGTTYKNQGRDRAIEIGFDFVKPKLSYFLAEVEKLKNENTTNLRVHCWRGGMRSQRFAEFLNENGHKTQTLVRGYKAYRQYVLNMFQIPANLVLLGGETGSGKTEILLNMKEKGQVVVDLEGLAHHKGSAFGSLGEKDQPSQEQFENDLAHKLKKAISTGKSIWLEDESRNIGARQIPKALWDQMKLAPIVRVQLPKSERIKRLIVDYGNFPIQDLERSILKIQKRLGPQHAKRAIEELESGNLSAVADISLTYYDKAYNYCHELREYRDVFFVECETADALANADKVLDYANQKLKKSDA